MNIRDKACAVLENVWLGLWVLVSECGWLLGEGLTADRHLAALRKQRDRMRGELAGLTVPADPRAAATQRDLELLTGDLARIEAVAVQRRSERLRAIRARFPGADWNA